ncbi:MAG: CoA transferase subunit A [Anaerolineales bacterium]
MNKIVSFPDIFPLIKPEDMIAIGGMTLYRRPVKFVYELIKYARQSSVKYNLTLLSFTGGYEGDLLIGAGLISRVRSCYFGLEIFGFAPMFTYFGNRGEIEILEETEASLAFGLRAQMAGVGFMPGQGWIATDLPKLRPDIKTIVDPYNQLELMAFPAIKPDLAVIHALIADVYGNAIIGKNKALDEELSITSSITVITAEQIVNELEQADIVAPFVDYVIEAPLGALPTSCHPKYGIDGKSLLEYTNRVHDPQSFNQYLEALLGA